MDWRYNTIWFDQIEKSNLFHCDYSEKNKPDSNFEDAEYVMTFYFKHKGLAFDPLPGSGKLLYLEMNWSNFQDLRGIQRFENLKRLELNYCTKLTSDEGITALAETLEFLHINQSKKYVPTPELWNLKKLKVLRLNNCGPIQSLKFLENFPELIEFTFVNTNILDGDLTPILNHSTIRTAGFLNKRHYNYSDKKIEEELLLKSSTEFKKYLYKGDYRTFRYQY